MKQKLTLKVILITLVFSSPLFINAQNVPFGTLGSNNTYSSGYKTVSGVSGIAVANNMYVDETGLFGFKGGSFIARNAVDFTFNNMMICGYDPDKYQSSSSIIFKDKNGAILQTMTLSADKNLSTNSISVADFFDNGTTLPIVGVAKIIFNIGSATTDPQGDTENVYYVSIDISPTPTNSAPEISLENTSLDYTENDVATPIDAAATLNDVDGDAAWNGGTLTAQITANNEGADKLTIADNNTGINTSGYNILYQSITIGTLSASEGTVTNGTMLTITFNTNATNAIVQEVARAISYESTSEDPGTSNRTVTFTVTDANDTDASDTRTILVAKADNDVPTVRINNGLNLDEGATKVIPIDSLESDDADTDNSTLVYTITSTLANGQLENSDNAGVAISSFTQQNLTDNIISYVHDGSNTTSDAFTFKVADGTNELTGQTFSVTIIPVNDAPVITTVATDLSVIQNESITLSMSNVTASDSDNDSDDLTLVISAGTNYTVNGMIITPATNFAGNLTVGVAVSDGDLTSEYVNMSIAVSVVTAIDKAELNVVNLYPNPTHSVVTINAPVGEMASIFTLSGKMVLAITITEANQQLNISSLPSGIYLVKVQSSLTKLIVN